MRVSRSRPCNLGASSLVSLTRVCNAIRSALVVKRGFASAGIYYTRSLAGPENLAKLSQRIELFHDFVKPLFTLANNTRGSFLERLLQRNAIEPALLGELLVTGKIEPDQQIHFAICQRSLFEGFRVLCFALCLGLRLWLFGFWSLGGLVGLLRLGF